MGSPEPLAWPASALVIPIRRHRYQRCIRFPEGEITITRWEDGEEETTLRIYCNHAQCCNTGHDHDHVMRISTYDAARIRALLHEITED